MVWVEGSYSRNIEVGWLQVLRILKRGYIECRDPFD